MKLFVKKLNAAAIMPARATAASAGADLHACLEKPVTIHPGETFMVPTGIAVQPSEKETALLIFPRSGLASKHGITLANAVGVVDSDYRGEIKIPLHNLSKEDFIVKSGMRVAQLVVTPVLLPEIVTADELEETERGSGGFGSSGI